MNAWAESIFSWETKIRPVWVSRLVVGFQCQPHFSSGQVRPFENWAPKNGAFERKEILQKVEMEFFRVKMHFSCKTRLVFII